MTDAEKAVIQAAEKWKAAVWEAEYRTMTHPAANDLADALAALRESRRPQPRWGVTGDTAERCYLTFDGFHTNVCGRREAIEAIAAALNAATAGK